MSYKQLTEGQRYQISAYLSTDLSFRQIAQQMGVSHSTISREIRRNGISPNDYKPQRAQAMALTRRHQAA